MTFVPRLTWTALVPFCSFCAFFAPVRVIACATVSIQNLTSENYVEAERAIIIWDSRHHVEHFIRQAIIHTRQPDLGFLVPTPETPELAEVDPRIFDLATDVGRPAIEPRLTSYTPWDAFKPVVQVPVEFFQEGARTIYDWKHPFPYRRTTVTGSTPQYVPVPAPDSIFEKDIAGYHATVFAAKDISGVTVWLKQNGYASNPDLEKWLASYAAKNWKVTAFRLIKDPRDSSDDNSLTTRAIRLSFATDQPFYPYSEPSDRQRASAASPLGRALRVAVLSDYRVSGELADHRPWPGKTEFAGSSTPSSTAVMHYSPDLTDADRRDGWNAGEWLKFAGLTGSNEPMSLPPVLTTFLDESNPRPGTADLEFAPSKIQAFYGDKNGAALPHNGERIIFYKVWPDFAALLVLGLFPGAPFYCGLKTLSLGKRPIATSPSLTFVSRLRIRDRLLGLIALVSGLFFSIPFGIGMLAGVATLSEEPVSGAIVILSCFPMLVICTASVHCGNKIWSNKWQERPAFVVKWDKWMGRFCVVGGVLAVIGVVAAVASNLPV